MTFIAGSILTAAQLNTYLSGNTAALRAGELALTGQTAWDVIYASSASQLARLPIGAAQQVLRVNAAGTGIEWGQMIKAWGQVANSGSASLTAGFNVASLNRTGTGRVTVTFTTAIGSANYAVVVSLNHTSDSVHITAASLASGSFEVRTDDGGSPVDRPFCFMVMAA